MRAQLEALEAVVSEIRLDAKDGTEEGEDMSVHRDWANRIAKAVRKLRASTLLDGCAGEVEAVAEVVNVTHNRAERRGVVRWLGGEFDPLPDLASGSKLYTRPPAGVVDEAMVERCAKAAWELQPRGVPWEQATSWHEQYRHCSRVTLLAALRQEVGNG